MEKAKLERYAPKSEGVAGRLLPFFLLTPNQIIRISLFLALKEALRFNNIQPESIRAVDSNVGVVWFEDEAGITYCVSIQAAEHEMDEAGK